MEAERRYYWLKLQHDFFDSLRVKKLRRIAGGDTYTIIYLKMQLKSISTGGILQYRGYEDSFAAELALDLNEDEENVRVTLEYLKAVGLIEITDDVNYFLPYAVENIGSETTNAQRVRECRSRQKMSSCNELVTDMKQSVTDMKQSVTDMKQSVTDMKRDCNVEREKEIEKEIEKESSFTHSYARAREETTEAEEPVENDISDQRKPLGKYDLVLLSDNQLGDLCTRLSLDELDHYLKVVQQNEERGKHYTRKTHYQAIMDMANKDRKVTAGA